MSDLECEHARTGRGAVAQMALGQEHLDTGIGGHEGNALGRIVGIERHVGGPRCKHAEEGNDHLRRALHAHAHAILRTHPGGSQRIRDSARVPEQLGVGEPDAQVRGVDRDRAGSLRCLSFEPRGQRRRETVVRDGTARAEGRSRRHLLTRPWNR